MFTSSIENKVLESTLGSPFLFGSNRLNLCQRLINCVLRCMGLVSSELIFPYKELMVIYVVKMLGRFIRH